MRLPDLTTGIGDVMTEEEISSSGQFTALSAADVATSYQTAGSTARPSVAAAPAAPGVAESVPLAGTVNSAKQPTTQEIDSAVAAANANLANVNRLLDYKVDPATGIYVALIRDSQTGVVLQQVPGADLLALARMLAAWTPGKHMLLDLKA
jgi:uncharacterized FlaG/YvyC family protein